jgi:hypothetical protein
VTPRSLLLGLHLGLLLGLLPACRREASRTPEARPVEPASAAPARGASIEITEVSFAGPGGHRKDASFYPGETVTCLLTARGFTYRDQRAEIVAAVRVTGPQGETVLDLRGLELIKGRAPSQSPGSLRTAAELRISAAAPPGRYGVAIELHDRLGDRRGSGRGSFVFLGTPEGSAPHLRLAGLRWAAGDEAFPGAVLPVALSLRGLRTQRIPGKGHRLSVSAETSLRDGVGNPVGAPRKQPLLSGELGFAPEAVPFELQAEVPAGTPAGSYTLRVELEDGVSGSRVVGSLPLRVSPGSELRLWTLHLHDSSGLPRERFLLGAQAFLRFALRGLRPRNGAVEATVDLAVAGPGGVYLAIKHAAVARGDSGRAAAKAGRFPAQIPVVLPTLIPTGRYRIVLRARDGVAGKETTAELPFEIQGSAPKPLASFAIAELDVRERPDLPTLPGDTFGAGRRYELTLLLGGVKPKEKRRLIYELNLEGSLRLRDLGGRIVHERKRLFVLRRELSFRPLRVPLSATWELPATLRGGLHDLELEVHDLDDNHVSQLRRRVEIVASLVAPRRGAPTPTPRGDAPTSGPGAPPAGPSGRGIR